MRFPLTVALYNCLLSFYFLWKLQQSTGTMLSLSYELIFGHFTAFFIPLVFGIVGLLTDSFNYFDLLSVCKFATYPEDCVDNAEVECIRGSSITLKLDWAYVSFVLVASAVSTISTALVYIKVRWQLRRTMYLSSGISSAVDTQQQERIRQVGIQSVCYTVAYLNSLLWPLFTKILLESLRVEGKEGEPGFYLLGLSAAMFFPMQGFFNGIIFLRPTFVRWKKNNPQRSAWWAFRQSLSGKAAQFVPEESQCSKSVSQEQGHGFCLEPADSAPSETCTQSHVS